MWHQQQRPPAPFRSRPSLGPTACPIASHCFSQCARSSSSASGPGPHSAAPTLAASATRGTAMSSRLEQCGIPHRHRVGRRCSTRQGTPTTCTRPLPPSPGGAPAPSAAAAASDAKAAPLSRVAGPHSHPTRPGASQADGAAGAAPAAPRARDC